MRIRVSIIVFVLSIFFIVPAAFAAAPISNLIEQEGLDFAKEKVEVKKAVNSSKPKEFLVKHKNDLGYKELVDINSPTEMISGSPYRVVIANRPVVETLLNGGNLSEFLASAPHHWEVPLLANNKKPVASFTIDFSEGTWQVVEMGGYLSPEHSAFSGDPKKITAFFKTNGKLDGDKFTHFRIPSLHMDFLYLATNNQEYFVPLIHSRDELYGLKNKQVYMKDQIVAAVGPTLKAGLENPGLISGIPRPTVANVKQNSHNESSKLPIYVFAGVLLFGGIAFYGYRKLNIKSND